MEKNLFIMELLKDLSEGWDDTNKNSGFFFVAVEGDEWYARGVGNQSLAAERLAESAVEFEPHAEFINDLAVAYIRKMKSAKDSKAQGQVNAGKGGES